MSKIHLNNKVIIGLMLALFSNQLFGFNEETQVQFYADSTVRGVVFHDRTENGMFDPADDLPLEGIAVSNGREITHTNEDGLYELPLRDSSVIFVIKPRDWMVRVDEYQIPRFYYFHSKSGASGTKFDGLFPTGALPDYVNFPLYPVNEPDSFEVLVFGDTQPRDENEIYYISHDVLPEVIGTDASFGITLGDIVFDNLDLFDHMKQSIATIGIPWHNVLGNHDLDFTGDNNWEARGAFYRVFGPSYYSFSYGPAHFIILDNIRWIVDDEKRYYTSGLGGSQLEYLKNDLKRLDKDQLIFILGHRPWVMDSRDIWYDQTEKDEFFKLISEFPNSVSLVAHTHRHYHQYLGKSEGISGDNEHHMVSVGAVCGAWWTGAPDEYGIPHAMMSDGTPTSYVTLHIDGNQWKMRWKAARKPEDFQMHIFAPDFVDANDSDTITITANIFNALPSADVKIRIGDSFDWIPMKQLKRADPVRTAVSVRESNMEGQNWNRISNAALSEYMWEVKPGLKLKPGVHVIKVKAIDDWWEYEGIRLINVR